MTALSSLKSRFDRLSPTTKYWLVMFFRVSPLIALIALAIGLGFIPPSSSSALLAVQDGSTTYTGSCDGSVCSWYGLRYAAAPIGNLRFAPPQPPPTPPATKRATAKKAMCPQGGSIDLQNEDCLYLNIQRPARVNLATKLPVLVFIHGGGFESGSGNQNSPAAMIELGAAYGQEAVVVRINYRLGLFGFLAGTELEAERDDNANNVGLNRGFQDMGMAMKWVQAHIEAFGGDSTKITIWGQSAGSFGASAQLLAHADTAPPFQAAILESGSPGGVPIDPVSVKDAQYNRVLMSTNCSSTADHLSCLRSVPWKIMRTISLQESSRASQAATLMRGFYAWTGVIDGGPSKGGFFSSSPSAVISSGAYAKIPILQGDCLDEGTYFAPHTFDNTSELSTWLGAVYFTNSNTSPADAITLLNQMLQAYPDDPSIGSPYNTVGAAPSDRFYGPTNQFKRAASIYGDIRYQSNRRLWLSAMGDNAKVYSYLYAQQSPTGSPALGVPHGSDLSAVLQAPPNPVSEIMARQFLAFAITQDPSSSSGLPAWPTYTSSQPNLIQYEDGAITQIKDDYRSQAIDLLNSPNVLKITGR